MTKEFARYLELMKERPEEFDNTDAEYEIISDPEKVSRFEAETGKIIGAVYESRWHIMVVDLVTTDGKKYFAYERLMPAVRKGAVVALTMCGDDSYILLKQYRHSLRDSQYSFPRGFAEKGLTPEENLRKELNEELGAEPEEVKFLGTVVADSGVSGVKVSVYLCRVNSFEERKHYEGIKKVEVFSRGELQKMICEGKITDGFTLSALQLMSASEN